MVYAVDFDGTLCEDAFPEIGAPRFAVIEFVKTARAAGDMLIGRPATPRCISYRMCRLKINTEGYRWTSR